MSRLIQVTLWVLSATNGFEEVFGLFDGMFKIREEIIWDNYKERFIHNIGFLRKDIDETDIIIHKYT